MENYKGLAKEYQKVLEDLYWKFNTIGGTSKGGSTEIICCVASGEKHSFIIETSNFVQDVNSYLNEFNINDYVSSSLTPGLYGATPPVDMLIDDAREIQRRLKTLSDALSDVQAAMIIEE